MLFKGERGEKKRKGEIRGEKRRKERGRIDFVKKEKRNKKERD